MEKIKELPKTKKYQIVFSLLAAAAIWLLRPLGLSWQQSGILAATLLVIIWWTLGTVPRTCASVFLLLFYLIFSGAGAKVIFTFPLSKNFLLIIFSFLFSQGISNSKLADKLLVPVLTKYCRTPLRLILMIVLLNVLMVFIIPQPFSRIIILASIFRIFFQQLGMKEEQCSVWLLALYITSVIVNMSILRGDIILNTTLLSMAGVTISELTWAKYMLLPTTLYLVLALIIFSIQNRRVIKETVLQKNTRLPDQASGSIKLDKQEKINLIFILFVVAVWALESIHGISGVTIVIIATAVMFIMGLLKTPDLKSVNIGLVMFLSAAFAIGGTLKVTGVADILFSRFATIFPDQYSLYYLMLILICTVVLHMVLGSNVTTMSIVVPGMMTMCSAIVPEHILVFLILIAICGHFLLPFHHVILLLGEGSGYYTTKMLVRFGGALTVLLFVAVLCLYLPWWALIGG